MLLLLLLVLLLLIRMPLQLVGAARACRMMVRGRANKPLGFAAVRHWMGMEMGTACMAAGAQGGGDNSDGGGGGREGIAAHERAMARFRIGDALLHEDADVVVMNKPPNALCVPGRYIKDSLVVRVAEHLGIPDYARMVVHRLDQATSGVVVFAKHERALKHLHAQLRDKAAAAAEAQAGSGGSAAAAAAAAMAKGYVALVAGGDMEPPTGRITLPIRKDLDNAPKQVG